MALLSLSFIKVCEEVYRATNVACSTDKIGECEKSDDLLSSCAHILKDKKSEKRGGTEGWAGGATAPPLFRKEGRAPPLFQTVTNAGSGSQPLNKIVVIRDIHFDDELSGSASSNKIMSRLRSPVY